MITAQREDKRYRIKNQAELTPEQQELVEKNTPLAHFMIGKLCRSGKLRLRHDQADDAAAEALAILCRVARCYRKEIGPFSTIACRSIARHLLSGRAIRDLRPSGMQDALGLVIDSVPSKEPDPATLDYEPCNLSSRLQECLEALPEQRLQAVRLTYLQGMTLEAAGKVMGISKERVRQHRNRALEMLREMMGAQGQDTQ